MRWLAAWAPWVGARVGGFFSPTRNSPIRARAGIPPEGHRLPLGLAGLLVKLQQLRLRLWNIGLLSLSWPPRSVAPSRRGRRHVFPRPMDQRASCNPLVTRTPNRSRNRLRGLTGLPRPPPATESHPQSQRRPTPILAAFRTGCRSGGGTG